MGKENFEIWFKRLTNYMSLTDENYGEILRSLVKRKDSPWTSADYDIVDQHFLLDAGDSMKMSRRLYYILDTLLGDTPWMTFDSTSDQNGFEAVRKLPDRYLQSNR